MNEGGHAATLVPAHPGNTNAERHGVYSARRRGEVSPEATAREPLQTLFAA